MTNPFKKREWTKWQHLMFVDNSFGETIEVFRSDCLLTGIAKYATVKTGTKHSVGNLTFLKREQEERQIKTVK